MTRRAISIHTDGACSGNPGRAACAFIIREQGRVLQESARFLGESTNNIAEYSAIVDALTSAHLLNAAEVDLNTDSELVVKQLNGAYQVKHPGIRPLFEQVNRLARNFQKITIRHIRREENREADQLARAAIKQEQAKTVASASFTFTAGEESPSSTG